ncbi:MAG: hypothetical protein RIF41_17835 [Polyangiaceae bacterium]
MSERAIVVASLLSACTACGSAPAPSAPPVTVEVATETSPRMVARPATQAPQPKRPAKKPFDWFAALGLRYGDREERLLELFGEPTGRDGDVAYFSHLDDPVALGAFNVTLNDDGTIYVLAIGSPSAAEHLRELGHDEELLDFVGRHVDLVKEKLGEPEDSTADTHTWTLERGPRRAQVMAFCYDFDDYLCKTVWLSWFY